MLILAALAIPAGPAGEADAGPVGVGYTVSGSPGDYDLDFRVTNDMTARHQNIYLFGVHLGDSGVAGSPAPFDSLGAVNLNWAFYGGSATNYNNAWQADPTRIDLSPGNSLSGFLVHTTDLVVPASVSWFAYSQDAPGFDNEPYTGGGNFNTAFSSTNPGFEGVAPRAVPEPSSLVLSAILLGMAGAARALRRATGPKPCDTTTLENA